MPLRSQLFRGDPKLEAAAVSDPAHIVPGARGEHVRRIQRALIQLDGASIAPDGLYGSATAAAVLAFKQKRNIVNRAYETKPDNIVGKMTIARLDSEVADREIQRRSKVVLRPISPPPRYEPSYTRARVLVAETNSKTLFVAAPSIGNGKFLPHGPIELEIGQTGSFEVGGGIGCTIDTTNSTVATTFQPDDLNAHDGQCQVDADPQIFGVRGRAWGSAMIVAHRPGGTSLLGTDYLPITVKDNRGTKYHPTDAHNHRPASNWDAVCDSEFNKPVGTPVESAYIWQMAYRHKSPKEVAKEAREHGFNGKPTALRHYDYYLSGHGGTLNEDQNLDAWIRTDDKARSSIRKEILFWRTSGKMVVEQQMKFEQKMYGDQDMRYTYGTIDKLDMRSDFIGGTVKLWFLDCYQWHPPHKEFQPPCSTPIARSTNFIHAALVQMKLYGAADFWMKGEAVFPMGLFGI